MTPKIGKFKSLALYSSNTGGNEEKRFSYLELAHVNQCYFFVYIVFTEDKM